MVFPLDMTMEKLLSGHNSEPQNLIIANVLYKLPDSSPSIPPTATPQVERVLVAIGENIVATKEIMSIIG